MFLIYQAPECVVYNVVYAHCPLYSITHLTTILVMF